MARSTVLVKDLLSRVRVPNSRNRRFALILVTLLAFGPGRPIVTSFGGDAHPDARAVGHADDIDWSERAGAPDYLYQDLDEGSPAGRFLSAEAAEASRQVVAVHKRTALLIGINRAKGGKHLPGSIADATNLRDALLGYGFRSKNITMLLEGAATAGAIRHHLDLLARRTPRDGIAVFAVATHTRRKGGQNELLTADGARIGSRELARSLGRVRSKMWVALPTCYAAGYALPGIIGRNRIATFASPQNQPTYQLGTAGSYLFINMVRKAMLEGRAPASVESAFRYAEETLRREAPDRVPSMSDGIRGKLVLGRMAEETVVRAQVDARSDSPPSHPQNGQSYVERYNPPNEGGSSAEPTPSPTPRPRSKGPVGVCGNYQYNCKPRG